MMSVTANIEKDVKNSNPMAKPYLFLKSTIYILATILSGRNRTIPEARARANIILVGNLKKSARLKSNFILSLLSKRYGLIIPNYDT